MPMIDRAAQFTPFQALTGYGAAIPIEDILEIEDGTSTEFSFKEEML